MQKALLKKIYFSIFVAFAFLFAKAQTAEEFFELGVKAYQKSDFNEAAECFENAAKMGAGAGAYHNAANAFMKLSKLGEARLNYERANYLNPRNPETKANLNKLLETISDAKNKTCADTLFGEISFSEWLGILFLSIWISVIFAFIIPFFVKKARWFRLLGVLGFLACLYSSGGAVYWNLKGKQAYVVSQDALLRISPVANSPASISVGEAKSVKILKAQNEYFFVKTQNKKYGWVKASEVKSLW